MSSTLSSAPSSVQVTSSAWPRAGALPSLLDRLTASRPLSSEKGRNVLAQSRDIVLRDLGWLLNCVSLEATESLDAYPHVRDSVLNFGMRTSAGGRVSATGCDELERAIREAVVRFEPRILAESVEVRCGTHSESHAALTLEISGQLFPAVAPQAFEFRTEIDVESGHIAIRAQAAM